MSGAAVQAGRLHSSTAKRRRNARHALSESMSSCKWLWDFEAVGLCRLSATYCRLCPVTTTDTSCTTCCIWHPWSGWQLQQLQSPPNENSHCHEAAHCRHVTGDALCLRLQEVLLRAAVGVCECHPVSLQCHGAAAQCGWCHRCQGLPQSMLEGPTGATGHSIQVSLESWYGCRQQQTAWLDSELRKPLQQSVHASLLAMSISLLMRSTTLALCTQRTTTQLCWVWMHQHSVLALQLEHMPVCWCCAVLWLQDVDGQGAAATQ